MIDIKLLLEWGATYRKVSSNDIIFVEGESCNYFYQVISGRVMWMNIDRDGRECIHAVLESGDSFGEFPLFDDLPYASSALADTDCVLIRLPKSAFLNMLEEHPSMLMIFTRMMVERLRHRYSLIRSMSGNHPEARILNLFEYLKSKGHNFCADSGQLKLTRQQIAGMTGLRVETVIRTIRNLQLKGELEIRRGKVYC